MKYCITNMPLTGNCELDLDKVCKRWNLLCRIYCHNGKEFRLVEKTPKGKDKLRITISEENALYLINNLQLTKVNHDLLKTTSIYLSI